MEKEETQGKISREEPHGQEAGRVKDPDLEERLGGGDPRAPRFQAPAARSPKSRPGICAVQGTVREGRQEIQSGAPREEQGLISSQAQRAQTGKDLPLGGLARYGHHMVATALKKV